MALTPANKTTTAPKTVSPASAQKTAAPRAAVSSSSRAAKAATVQVAQKQVGPAKVVAIVRVRGVTGLHPKRVHTMELLNICRTNCATLVPDSPILRGMLHSCKDYVTWGSVSEPIIEKLLTKRGHVGGVRLSAVKKPAEIKAMAAKLAAGETTLKSLEMKRVFRLTPPSGGWSGKKYTYPNGDLGPRPNMDALLKSMM